MTWQYHQNVTAYDAFCVAAANVLEAPLLTADGRLARAPGLGITIQHIRMSCDASPRPANSRRTPPARHGTG